MGRIAAHVVKERPLENQQLEIGAVLRVLEHRIRLAPGVLESGGAGQLPEDPVQWALLDPAVGEPGDVVDRTRLAGAEPAQGESGNE
jgi:hypothetical protein